MDESYIKSIPVLPSEITPEEVYLSRRDFIKGVTALGVGAAILSACSGLIAKPSATEPPGLHVTAQTDELKAPLTSYDDITNYNNYYEFTTFKTDVAENAASFKSSPWQVQVGGLVANPKTYSIDDILKRFTQEERVYRLRCVEAWSMVIPWTGFPLVKLLKEAEPLRNAKYVRFETVFAPDEMPRQKSLTTYPWPYTEGLRIDEAMNDLAILATGLYGKPLPVQDGSPIRLIVPWKYGFKGAKTIVKIDLVDTQPSTFWSTLAPDEYGFYANVNPEVPHPRWSQKTERRIGEAARRKTLMFNGYAEQVANLYQDMDLRLYY
ncbi:MAG: protein-methionine-sulfoxide reductase catalytic subunit MsrP [Omnitrophica WOR_2 bacterium]